MTNDMEETLTFEEIVDRALVRLLDGEPPGRILAAYPKHAPELAPMLQSAAALATVPAFDPTPAQRAQAMRRMLDQVETSAAGAGAAGRGGIMSIFNPFRGRPLAFQGVAIAGALVLFGGLGLGASAAAGNTPQPVRSLFGISSTSTIRVELEGTIVTIEPSTSTLTISVNGDIRAVIVTGDTELTSGGDLIALGDFRAGQVVEVKGALRPDNSIVATRVHLEDGDDDDNGTPVPETPDPTADDHEGDGDDDDGVDDDGDDGADHDEGDVDDGDQDDGDDNDNDDGEDNDHDDGDVDDFDDGPGGEDDDGNVEDNSGPGSSSDDDSGDGGRERGDDDHEDGRSSGLGERDDGSDSGGGGGD